MPSIRAQFKPVEDVTTRTSFDSPDQPPTSPQVDLQFTAGPTGQSYLSTQLAKYPYHIGRLLKNSTTPPAMAMLYLQCTSGGLFEDDSICINICARENAVASIQHAAATVVHSMQKNKAMTQLKLVAEESAYVEYTGNLNILFPKSRLQNQIDIQLHPKAIALVSDAYLIHDPEQQSAHFEEIETTINVYNPQQTLLVRDRFLLSGEQLTKQLQAVSRHYDTHATIYILTPDCESEKKSELLELINASIIQSQLGKDEAYIGFGSLPKQCGVFVRLICHSGEPVKKLVTHISNHLRNITLARDK